MSEPGSLMGWLKSKAKDLKQSSRGRVGGDAANAASFSREDDDDDTDVPECVPAHTFMGASQRRSLPVLLHPPHLA